VADGRGPSQRAQGARHAAVNGDLAQLDLAPRRSPRLPWVRVSAAARYRPARRRRLPLRQAERRAGVAPSAPAGRRPESRRPRWAPADRLPFRPLRFRRSEPPAPWTVGGQLSRLQVSVSGPPRVRIRRVVPSPPLAAAGAEPFRTCRLLRRRFRDVDQQRISAGSPTLSRPGLVRGKRLPSVGRWRIRSSIANVRRRVAEDRGQVGVETFAHYRRREFEMTS